MYIAYWERGIINDYGLKMFCYCNVFAPQLIEYHNLKLLANYSLKTNAGLTTLFTSVD